MNTIKWRDADEMFSSAGKTSFELVYYFMENSLAKNKSIIVDANFYPDLNNDRLNELKKKYDCQILQIHCFAERRVIEDGYVERFDDPLRHSGYMRELKNKYKTVDKFLDQVGIRKLLLDIDGKTIKVDTTDVHKINHDEIYDFVNSHV